MLQRKRGQAGRTGPFGPHGEERESSVSWRKALACRRHRPDWGQMANKEIIAFRKSGMTDT